MRKKTLMNMDYIFILTIIACASSAVSRQLTKGTRDFKDRATKRPQVLSRSRGMNWFNCNFESGYCNWTNDTSAEFNWYRTAGETPTKDTGPPWDHTKAGVRGEGHYIYIETSVPREYGDKARLVSPTITKPGTYCLTFWHHMHGSDVKDLNVFVKSRNSRKGRLISRLSEPWSVENNIQTFAFGQDGDWWNEENAEFTINEPVNVVFEGVRGKNFRGDIAVDDISLIARKCPRKSIDCNFENNTCGWTQMSNDEFNWLPNRGGTITKETGPAHDHTFGNADGRYLYIEASWPRVEGDKARLLSPPVQCDEGAKAVFNFWYNMNGPHVGPLRVYVTKDEHRLGDAVWELSGQQGEDWQLGQVTIPAAFLTEDAFKIVIEAERKDYRGDASIDDISLTGCRADDKNFGDLNSLTTPTTTNSPTTQLSTTTTQKIKTDQHDVSQVLPGGIDCNFDQNNMCAWRQVPYDHFNWELNQGITHSERTGPSSDHTTRKGWYLYLEASAPRKLGDTAMIRSPVIPSSIHSCLTFFYHMRGRKMGKLEVLTSRKDGDRFNKKWGVQGQQSINETDWKQARVDLAETFNYEITLRGVIGIGFYSDIAIDDIVIHPVACDKFHSDASEGYATTSATPTETANGNKQVPGHISDCAFTEGGACNWSQVSSPMDEFDWTFAIGDKTPSSLTGPNSDHTAGSSGGYAYIEASTPRVEGDRAILESPVFEAKIPLCFHIWYHMLGPNTGKLAVYTKAEGSGALKLQWSRSGNRGDQWLEALINIRMKGRFNVIVEAERGEAWNGDIAIDDFKMTEGKCPELGCNFEDDTCAWLNDKKQDDFDWIINSGNTTSKNTGPNFDRTLGNETGHYMYIEASNPRERDDIARLVSPVVDPDLNNTMCLTFWYHSFGKHIGSLNVYKKLATHKDEYLGSPMWYSERNEGDRWLFAKINVYDALPFQIVIEGVVGVDYMGDIAIDDIELSAKQCDSCCNPSHFKCGNNFCIHESLRCNKKDDCGDSSDESFCDYEPKCGTPFSYPIIREPMVLPSNIVRDEDPSTIRLITAPSEEEDLNTGNILPDRNDDKESGNTRVPKISRDQAKLIAHPKLGFDPVQDAGYYYENVARSRVSGRPETFTIQRKRRASSRSVRRKRSTDGIKHSMLSEIMRSIWHRALTYISSARGFITSYFAWNSDDSDIQNSNEAPTRISNSSSSNSSYSISHQADEGEEELHMVDLLKVQQQEKQLLRSDFQAETWEQKANTYNYIKRKSELQATLGQRHSIPAADWKLMAPSRKYMKNSEKKRAKRSVKKIVGGKFSNQYNYPWQAAYYITDSATESHFFCGATLIDRYWVITAAHCPRFGDEHVVVLGDYDLFTDENTEQECIVEAIFVHEVYKFSEDLVGDIALIQLRYPARSSKSVQPACLLKRDEEPFPPKHVCFATGWGRINPDESGVQRYLRQVEMPILSNEKCQTTFWSIYTIHDSYVCAGGTGGNTCRGDSGGPLMCMKDDRFYLVGITSWGDTRCKPNIPGIYTRVQSYTKWMKKIMDLRNECN